MAQRRASDEIINQLNTAVESHKAGTFDTNELTNLVNSTYSQGYLNFDALESSRNYLMGLAGAPGSKESDTALAGFDAIKASSPSGLAHTARLAGTATPEQMPYIKGQTPTPTPTGAPETYVDPNQAGGSYIYRDNQNNFYSVGADGTRKKLNEQEAFSDGLGINETFVKPGETVSLEQARTGRSAQQVPQSLDILNQGAMTSGLLPSEQKAQQLGQQGQAQQTDALVSQIMGLYSPTDRESQLEQQLNQMQQSYELGQSGIENQTVPMQIISSQQAQLERQAQTRLQGLRNELGRLQGDREGQLRALQFSFDARRMQAQDALAWWKATSPENLMTLEDQGLMVMRSPVTGETWSVPIPGWKPPTSAQKPIEVSPGASLFDPVTGRSIFTAPTAKQTSGGSVPSGGVATTQPQVKLSSAQQTDVADMRTMLSQLDKMDEITELKGAVGFFTGPVESVALKLFGQGNERDAEVRAMIGNVKAQLAKLRGGTSFTANEQKLLESYVPSINESPESIVAKVRALRTYLSSKMNQVISTAGGTPDGASSDPLGLFK